MLHVCFIDFLHLETVEYEPPDSDSDEVEEEEEEDEEDNSMWQEDALLQTVNNESGFSCKKNKSSGCSKFKQKPYMYFLEYSTLNLSLQLSELCLDKCWKNEKGCHTIIQQRKLKLAKTA